MQHQWPPTDIPGRAPVSGLTSIVVLALNEWAYTERCLNSVVEQTTSPYELVVVDNGSTDQTAQELSVLARRLRSEGVSVTVVSFDDNLGFGGGCNAGIRRSNGEFVLFLNNDTVVTKGWLSAMLAVAELDPLNGVIGPRSNHVAGHQLVADIPYDPWTLKGLDSFVVAWRSEHFNKARPTTRLIGFCLLVRRAVIDAIGGFDVRFGIGNFEDDDLCLRAQVAGFRCWQVDDSFVHHFGSRTFVSEGIDYSASMSQNWQLFARRWHLSTDAGKIGDGYFPAEILAREQFSADRHYVPVVETPDDGSIIELTATKNAIGLLLNGVEKATEEWALSEVLSEQQRRTQGENSPTVILGISSQQLANIEVLEQSIERIEQANGSTFGDLAIATVDTHNEASFFRLLRSIDGITLALCPPGERDRALHAFREGLDDIRVLGGRVPTG